MSATRLFTVSILAKEIVFIKPADKQSKLTVTVKFPGHGEQTLFEPVARSTAAGGAVTVDAGKSFTVGLSPDVVSSMARRFMMTASLHQTDPVAERLSVDAAVDFTRTFRMAFEESDGGGKSNTQRRTIVEFYDEAGDAVARLELAARMTVSGATMVREFSVETNGNAMPLKQYMTPVDRRAIPAAPEFRCPRKSMGTNDGEWDVVCGVLDNGQKIAIKYRRSYYSRYKPTAGDDPCPRRPDDVPPSRSVQKLETYVLNLLAQMHHLVVSNRMLVPADNDPEPNSRNA